MQNTLIAGAQKFTRVSLNEFFSKYRSQDISINITFFIFK